MIVCKFEVTMSRINVLLTDSLKRRTYYIP